MSPLACCVLLAALACGGGSAAGPMPSDGARLAGIPNAAVARPRPSSPDGRLAAPAPDPPEDRWFAEDKARHFFVSFAAAALAFGTASAAGVDWPEGGVAAGGVAAAAGLWKEHRDRRTGGRFSAKDLVWDAAGIAAALLLASRTD